MLYAKYVVFISVFQMCHVNIWFMKPSLSHDKEKTQKNHTTSTFGGKKEGIQVSEMDTTSQQSQQQTLPLQERLRIRHRQLLSNFDESRQHRTQVNDAAAADRLVSLRTELSNHRLASETRIINALRENDTALLKLEKKRSERAAATTAVAAAAAAAVGGDESAASATAELAMPNDDFHGPSGHIAESYEEVLAHRRERVIAARMRVVQIALDIRREHVHRMHRVDELEKQLFQFEQARQTEVEKLTRELIEGIISIALVNVTQAQAIAQGILVEENERALANNVGMTSLFSRLRQHELLHFRGAMKQLRDVMSRTEQRAVKSILVWTTQILAASDRFRRPPGRFELLAKTREMVVQAGRNLKHVVANITAAAESLPRKPRPTATAVPLCEIYSTHIPLPESKVPCDIPGGTGDGGWLRHLQIDDPRALQPFKRTPDQVTAEWTQALETVLEHFGTGSEERILSAQQHGAMLNASAQTIIAAMHTDIQDVFVPGAEEQRLRDTCARDYFPFFEAPPTQRELRKEARERRRATAWQKIAELDAATQLQLEELEKETEQASNAHGKGSGRAAGAGGSVSAPAPSAAAAASGAAAAGNNKRGATQLQKMQEQISQQQQAEREKLLAEAEAKSSDDDEDNNSGSKSIDVYTKYEFVQLLIFEAENSQREIKVEAKWFADFLSLHLLRQFEVATDAVHRNGFYALCTEATALLQGTVQRVISQVRSSVLWQEESQRDFRDTLTKLERAYQLTEERLSAAGTITEATALCEQASGLLAKIAAEYTNNYNRSADYLKSFAATGLPQLLEKEASNLFMALSVQPVDLKRMREEEAARKRALLDKEKEQQQQQQLLLQNRRGGGASGAASRSSPTRRSTIGSPLSAKRGAAAGNNDDSGADAADENSVAHFLSKHTIVSSMRGSTYIVTAPAEGVMELGGSLAELLLRRQVEEADKSAKEAAVAAAALVAAGGGAGGNKSKTRQQQQPNAAAAVPAAAPAATGASGRASTKMTKQQREELDRLQLEEAARREAEQAAKKLLPHEERFLTFLRREFSGIFSPQCLIAPTTLPAYVGLLRSMMLDWYEEFRATAQLVSAAYVKTTTDQLSLETHECIRRHARRPVTLQSQVFEVRIRELQDAADARADWFQRLMHRAQRAAETAVRGIADTEVIVANTTSALEDLREEICDASTVAAIDAQSRALGTLLAEHGTGMKSAVDGVVAKCEEHLRAVNGEIAFFEAEKLKTLEEGGTLTGAEKAICQKAVQDVGQVVAAARTEVRAAADECLEKGGGKAVAQWRAEFEVLLEVHRREVSFLREMGDQLTKARGTVSVSLSQSAAAHGRLSSAVERLELFASGGSDGAANMVPPRSEHMPTLRAVAEFCKTSFAPASATNSAASSTATATAAKLQQSTGSGKAKSTTTTAATTMASGSKSKQSIHDAEAGLGMAPDERIRSPLLLHRIAREKALLHGSRVAKLAELITALRFMLAERGLQLGCLVALPEWDNTWIIPAAAASASPAAFSFPEADDQMMQASALAPADAASSSLSLSPSAAAATSVAASGNWISLDYSKAYLEANTPEAVAAAAAAAAGGGNRNSGRKPAGGGGGGGAGGSSSPTKPGSRGNNASVDPLQDPALLPPMRNSTVRMEWQAQKLLDRTERDIHRLVAAHFKPPQTAAEQQQQLAAAAAALGSSAAQHGAAKKQNAKAAAAAAAASEQANEAAASSGSGVGGAAGETKYQLPPVTSISRSSEYGADPAAIREKVAKLLVDQLGRVTDHVSHSATEYRVLVRKVQVAIHGAAEELFAAMLHFQMATLNEGLRIVLNDFEALYRGLLEEQRQIQMQLRAPLAAPSHAKEWQALCAREARRRAAVKFEMERLGTNFATELVQSGRVANVRVVQALAAFFSVVKSFVLIRHLDGGDNLMPETGHHRGLRRLLRLKLREEVGGPKVVTEDAAASGSGADKKKGAAASGKTPAAPKKSTGAAGGAGRSGDAALQQSGFGNGGDAPDPVPPPNLAPPAAPPVRLAGVTAGRTVVPASSPEIGMALQLRAASEAAPAATQQPAANKSTGTSAATAASKKADAAAIPVAPSAAALAAAESNTPSGILVNMCVPSAPAPWLDDASRAIFKQIALAAAQSAADSASATAATGAGAAAGGGGTQAPPLPTAAPKQPVPRGPGGAASKDAAAAAAAAQLALLTSFFDPAVPYQSGSYVVLGGANSETRIFPVSYSAAQLSIDKMDQAVSEAAQAMYAKMKQFEEVESRWCVAWNSAAESLGATSSATHQAKTTATATTVPVVAPPTKSARG